ncbi:DUF1484 domain-containing protein [Cupriavidus taiwanensis]|uniref:DUF1484 domain-containing protein n=1 Tax=Cupriavidus taiwanensis TaxID=164546 RepID=UPI000E109849|nr:DUF1484 domain-containing protein [Cupriavidus taiwanensis]SPA56834.1 conserved protein of unknown function [Cupriavidus taiwanensis]
MQEKTHPQHETIFIGIPAETLESLDRVQAGMGSVLSLLEIESERSEGCHASIAC